MKKRNEWDSCWRHILTQFAEIGNNAEDGWYCSRRRRGSGESIFHFVGSTTGWVPRLETVTVLEFWPAARILEPSATWPTGPSIYSYPNSLPQQCLTLILGDDNFTFTLPFLESRHHWAHEAVEVASCLAEDKIPNEYRPNYLALRAQGVQVHFGINPAQLRNHFFNNQYSRMIFILPGLAFTGFPEFLDKKADPLFRLRLHIYMFGFLKSSRNALKPDALIQILWPRQEMDRPAELPQWVPWHGMDLGKIGEHFFILQLLANSR